MTSFMLRCLRKLKKKGIVFVYFLVTDNLAKIATKRFCSTLLIGTEVQRNRTNFLVRGGRSQPK